MKSSNSENRVKRRLNLGESASRREQQRTDTDDRGEYTGRLVACALDHRLQDFGALLTDKTPKLGHNRALSGIVTKDKTRDRYDDDQQWSNREDRIVGNRGAAAEVLVFDKSEHYIFNENPRLADHEPPLTIPRFDDPVVVSHIPQHVSCLSASRTDNPHPRLHWREYRGTPSSFSTISTLQMRVIWSPVRSARAYHAELHPQKRTPAGGSCRG